MSMPRPAAVTQWLAEQGSFDTGGPRSTPVLMAIALLATLCVIGVGALVAYKVRVGDQRTSMLDSPSAPTATYDPLAPATEVPTQDPTTTTEPSAARTATKVATRPTDSLPKGTAPPGTVPAGTGSADASKENGFLTIYCKPACDQVIAGGRSLGASPVSNVPMPPGQHRVTLKRAGSQTKVISVIVVTGQLTSHSVTME
jgi:serine/threonine-protein kinase